MKSISKKPAEEEMKTVKASFCDDFDDQSLPCELELLPTIFRGFKPVNFSDVVDIIQSLSNEKRKLIKNVVIIIRLVLTLGAISTTPERSFSTMRRLKTLAPFNHEPEKVQCFDIDERKQGNPRHNLFDRYC